MQLKMSMTDFASMDPIMAIRKSMSLVIIAMLGLACTPAVLGNFNIPFADPSFTNSCAYPGANFTDYAIGVYCLNNDKADNYLYNYTWMDLDKCLGNNNGQLVGYDNGNYSQSCTGCAMNITEQSIYIQCNCTTTPSGSTKQSSVDLNAVLSNVDGALSCYGHLGNSTARADD